VRSVSQYHSIEIVRSREDQPLPNFDIALLHPNPQGKGRKKRRAGHERTVMLDILVADAPSTEVVGSKTDLDAKVASFIAEE
jgi:hypothetical protein